MFRSRHARHCRCTLRYLHSQNILCPYFYSHTSVHTTSTPGRNSNFVICPNAYHRLLHGRPNRIRSQLTHNSRRSIHVTVPRPETVSSNPFTGLCASSRTSAPIHNSKVTSYVADFSSYICNPRRCSLPRRINSSIVHQTSKLFNCRLIIVISSLSVNISSVIHNHSLLHSATLRV